jgi:hypothetical protein
LLYVAKSGDTLAGIAARFGTNPQTILANNVILGSPTLAWLFRMKKNIGAHSLGALLLINCE